MTWPAGTHMTGLISHGASPRATLGLVAYEALAASQHNAICPDDCWEQPAS